jgi:phosphoserine aminotransferase
LEFGLANPFFEGKTLNTPSLLGLEDFYQALLWAQRIGGAPVLYNRCLENAQVIEDWVARTPWIEFLAQDPVYRSPSTLCLRFTTPEFQKASVAEQWTMIRAFAKVLALEGVAFDVVNHAGSEPSLRLWAGPTREIQDMGRLTPWLDWARAISL